MWVAKLRNPFANIARANLAGIGTSKKVSSAGAPFYCNGSFLLLIPGSVEGL